MLRFVVRSSTACSALRARASPLLACGIRRAPTGLRALLKCSGRPAQQLGVSRATFDTATRGLEPDLSLPDLAIPGQPEKAPPGQAGVRADAGAISARGDVRSARRARPATRRAIPRHAGAASRKRSACPAMSCWRSGRARPITAATSLPLDAIRTLATQAYVGKRKEFFRNEFLHALKMLQDGVPRADMRSSWGGAMGLTQFLPSEFYKYAVDFDGDGRADIFRSVPDALASAAKQLAGKGWQTGERWAYEVRAPQNADCTMGVPDVTDADRRMAQARLRAGQRPRFERRGAGDAGLAAAAGRQLRAVLPDAEELLRHQGLQLLRSLRAVRRPSERPHRRRESRSRRRGARAAQLKTTEVETMQQRLTALGLYKDKIDGKAGMLTRAALGALSEEQRLEGRLLADGGGARAHAALKISAENLRR